MSSDFTIRPVAETDLIAVQSCLRETWHATYDPIFGAEQVATITSRWHAIDALQRHLVTPETTFMVALQGADAVGTASARRITFWHASLQWLYVLPRAQGRGLGKRLMEAALAPLGAVERITLDVEPRNTKAIGFYVAQGFRQIALEEREHAGSKDMAAVFEKLVGRSK